MADIIAIYKAPFATTPDPNVTVKEVALVYGVTAFLLAVLVKS
jgi:hypothetical protein